jgi:hypothetical protein
MGGKGTLIHCWWECNSITTMENNMEATQNTKNRTAICPSNSTPKDTPEGICQVTTKAPAHPCLFTIAKLWKQPRCLTIDEWIKKMWYLYMMEFHLSHKEE